jgi:hypothetical protein
MATGLGEVHQILHIFSRTIAAILVSFARGWTCTNKACAAKPMGALVDKGGNPPE